MSLGKKKMLSQGASAAPIPVGTDNFNTVIYSGNGSSQNVDTVGFKPDLVILKARNASVNNMVTDSVRGASYGLATGSNDQHYYTANKSLNSFRTLGFSVSGQANGGYRVNGSSGGQFSGTPPSYVAWCWKAGGNSNTFNIDGTGYSSASLAGLDTGTINPTGASVNTQAGFAIIEYGDPSTTGTLFSVSHGLGSTPKLILTKETNNAQSWVTYYGYKDSYLLLDSSAAAGSQADTFPNVSATTFGMKSGWSCNPGATLIGYVFADVAGYQKVGTYNGTGNSGNDIDVGFQPRFVMIKRTDASRSWQIFDSVRGASKELYPDLPDIEYGSGGNVINSDGFTPEGGGGQNVLNGTYIYLAIA